MQQKIEKYSVSLSKGQKLSLRLHRLRSKLQALEYYIEASELSLPSDLDWHSNLKRWFGIVKEELSYDRDQIKSLFSSVREVASGLFSYKLEIDKAKEQIKMLKIIIPRLMLKRALIKQEANTSQILVGN